MRAEAEMGVSGSARTEGATSEHRGRPRKLGTAGGPYLGPPEGARPCRHLKFGHT